MRELTLNEKQSLEKTVELWAAIRNLKIIHPDDIHEFRSDIHDIQNRILARPNSVIIPHKELVAS